MNKDSNPFKPLDPGRVNAVDPVELRYWCAELGCGEAQLLAAVAAVGEHVAAVRERLGAVQDAEGGVPSEAELGDPREEMLRRIVERPDGLHWVAADGHQEFGPYETIEEALAAMTAADDDAPEPGETLAEVEQELGIAEWLDPDTGLPAEDTKTRIRDE